MDFNKAIDPKINPFEANGYEIHPAPEIDRLFLSSGKPVSERESEVFWDAYEKIIQATGKAGRSSKVIPASEAISHIGEC